MAGINLGPDHDLAVRLQQMEDNIRALSTRDVLQNANIGAGGLTVDGGNITIASGGSLIVTGTGTISLATGTFNANLITSNTDVNATGNVNGTNVTGVNVFAQSLATVITAARVSLWGRTSDGYIATASSSERFKTSIVAVDVEDRAAAILQVSVSYFEYIDEVRKRDDPTFPDYVGPEYHVGTNLGAIAEQLHSLGLWEWVVYEREDDGVTLKLDENGEPIPFGIHDILMGWAALIVAQSLDKRIKTIEQNLGL